MFCLDSFGGGLIIQSLLALWLFQRVGLSIAPAGSIVLSAGSVVNPDRIIKMQVAADAQKAGDKGK